MQALWVAIWWLVTLLALASAGCAAPELAATDGRGAIEALFLQGEQVDIRTDLRIPTPGWQRIPGLGQAQDVQSRREDGRRTWTGRIPVAEGQSCRYEETLEEVEGAVRLTVRVTAEAEVPTEGVYLWVDLPVPVFAAGECELAAAGQVVASAEMPRERAQPRHFASGEADRATMTDAGGAVSLEVALDRALAVTVQDNREWDSPTYSAFFQLAPGPLQAGQTVELQATLKLGGEPDRTPAHLTLGPGTVRYRLDGFGGNYCFGIESPVTQYTLDHLRPAWARTEMTLTEWEPENDNDSPEETDWAVLEAHDQPDSNLRREFQLAKEIQERGIPYVISIWRLPEWLYADPGRGPNDAGRRVDPEQWPELLECIGSYLLYAKRQYGVEPELFCFNEANIGVYVYFSAEEHREAIKRIGAHLRQLGLRTKMLLADATGPQGTHVYAEPAAADPEAMQYFGAVAFHSWGGGSAADYGAWGDLAERLGLPLLVTELGVDPAAWRENAYDSFAYGMREVQMYQELLRHARPQGTMQWEFTNDYGLVHEERGADSQVTLVPTVRYHLVRHFCNLTPRSASALGVECDYPGVLFTAFAGDAGGRQALTLHLANLAAGRRATITGLPREVRSLRAIRTSETESFAELEAVSVRDGSVEIELAPRSLLTLTTMPAD